MREQPSIGRGRFEVRATLGTGAFGTVLAAFDRERGHLVAIKRPHLHASEALYRFKQEFRALTDLSHPNLVSLYELFEDGGHWFFTMELVDGVPLTAFLRRELAPGGEQAATLAGGSLDPFARTASRTLARSLAVEALASAPEPAAAATGTAFAVAPALPELGPLRECFAQVTRGLLALHAAQMLHRDIKPSNVLVTAEGRVVVLDFGLVRRQTRAAAGRASDSVVGTPLYMAPELWLGESVGEASDWYSVGVMLYEALLGESPFGGSLLEIMQQKAQGRFAGPRERHPEVPPELDELCRGLLRPEADTRPRGAEVLRAFDGDGEAPVSGVLPLAPQAVFVGRERELAELGAALAACRDGAAVVHVTGEPGIGKTALCRAFLAELEAAPEPRVLRGRCHEQESVPFKALDAVVDELAWELRRRPSAQLAKLLPRDASLLARLFPVMEKLVGAREGSHGPAEHHPLALRRRAFAALRELLRRMTADAPLVLWIDDLQWGDGDSAAALHGLLCAPDPPRVLVLLSYRDDAGGGPFLAELRALEAEAGALPGARALALPRLSEADGQRMAAALAAERAPQRRIDRVVREAAGIPLLLDQLARAVADDSVDPSRNFGDDEGRDLLAALVARQVAELPVAARTLLELVAVAGVPTELAVLRAAAGLPAIDRALLRPLRARHLVRVTAQEQLAPAYAQLAGIVAGGLDAAALRAHHRALAQALARAGAPPRRVAGHWHAAGEPERAGESALAAARLAADALAFAEAATCYRLALEWRPGDAAQRRRLRRALADALVHAGRCREAAPIYLELVDGADALEAIALRRLASEQLLSCGELDAGEATLRALAEEQGVGYPDGNGGAMLSIGYGLVRLRLRGTRYTPRDPPQIDAAALAQVDTCLSASRNLSLSRSIYAMCFGVKGLRLALDLGARDRIVEGLAMVGGGLGLTGDAAGKRMFEQAEALAEMLATPRARGVVGLWRGFFRYGEGRWGDARRAWEAAAGHLGECPDLTLEILRAQAYALLSLMHLGEYRELALRTAAAMAVARETGNLYTEVTALMYSAFPRLAAGDLADARARLRESEARTPRDGWNSFSRMKLHVQCDFYAGRAEAALARLDAAQPEIEASRMRSFTTFRVVVGALHAGAALQVVADGRGERRPLLRQVRRELARYADEPLAFARGLAALTRAGLARAEGDARAAAQQCEAAVAEFDAGGCPVESACAARRLGELLGGAAGAARVAAADAALRARGVADPARWTACFAPGFPDPDLSPRP
jgi:hypothetical protein